MNKHFQRVLSSLNKLKLYFGLNGQGSKQVKVKKSSMVSVKIRNTHVI